MMDFVLADIYTNADIMKQAADAVKQLEESGFDFSNLKNSRLENRLGLQGIYNRRYIVWYVFI